MHRKHYSSPPKKVVLFVTCMVDMIYPDAGMATVELLEKQGIEVIFPMEQTCCGQPAFNAGYRDEARTLATRFVDIFYPLVIGGQVDAIVTPSGSCDTMVSHFYDVLFEAPELATYRSRAAALSEVTFELTEFLVDVLNLSDVGAQFAGKITYHACCHLLRELKIDQPTAHAAAKCQRCRSGPTQRQRRLLRLWRALFDQKCRHQHRHGAAQNRQYCRKRSRRRCTLRCQLHDAHQRAAQSPGATLPSGTHCRSAQQPDRSTQTCADAEQQQWWIGTAPLAGYEVG